MFFSEPKVMIEIHLAANEGMLVAYNIRMSLVNKKIG